MGDGIQSVLMIVFSIAALGWLIQVLTTIAFLGRARSRENHDLALNRAKRIATTTLFAAIPLALVTAAAGAWIVRENPDLSVAKDWWIGTAIGSWIVAFFGSTLGRAAQLRQAVRVSTSAGSDDEDVRWRIRNVDLVSRGELLLLSVAAIVVVLHPNAKTFL